MNSLLSNTEEDLFFATESIDISDTVSFLSRHMQNKLYYNPSPFRTYSNSKLSGNYATKNLRETVFISCLFENIDLSEAGLAGSVFEKAIFKNGNYKNTNFHSSDFRNTSFDNVHLINTSFDKSVFWNSNFSNSTFDNVSFCDCIFINCVFSGCIWTVRVENAIFDNCIIKDTVFRHMNFEFSTFRNIHIENSKLPYPTIPYIYGGLEYLMTTKDKVRITSQTNKKGITKEEYLLCIDQLEKYYIYTQNYFPLSNILISKREYSKALASIRKGFELSILLRRFRMLPNYCKMLAYIPGADIHTKQSLYTGMLEYIENASLKDFERENLSMYLPQVTSMLLKDSLSNCVYFFIDTNIDGKDTRKISILYEVIDNLFSGICTYSIQLRHDSPLTALIQFFTDPSNETLVLQILQTTFIGVQTAFIGAQTRSIIQSNKISKESDTKNANNTEGLFADEKNIEKKQSDALKKITDNNIVFSRCSITINGNVYTKVGKKSSIYLQREYVEF